MVDTIDLGDVVTLTGEFRVAGVLTDPTTVACEVRAPDGTVTTPATTRRGVGVYDASFTPTQSGVHSYRFVGTGAATGAGQSYFRVA